MANLLVTVDTIIDFLKEQVEQKLPLSPSVWLDAAMKLNVLLADEHDILFDLQQKVANKRVDVLQEDEKGNVSRAKMYVEASDEYRDMNKQKAKIERIEEFIRLSKVQARMKDNEFRG